MLLKKYHQQANRMGYKMCFRCKHSAHSRIPTKLNPDVIYFSPLIHLQYFVDPNRRFIFYFLPFSGGEVYVKLAYKDSRGKNHH